MIYLKMRGRIGNQLFMYATARMIQVLKGNNEKIIIEDYKNESPEGIKYENSLLNYKLNNVEFVSTLDIWKSRQMRKCRFAWYYINNIIERNRNNDEIYDLSIKNQALYNKFGIFHIMDGYINYPEKIDNIMFLEGYFQSEKFFKPIEKELVEIFRLDDAAISSYPNYSDIIGRNTVCISIKVQHNAGNYMYDVCHQDYYKKAIEYIVENVENPLFFICSDNVDYVKENLIDTSKYDVVCQSKDFPVHISLAMMARCKHFVIGNTSFGWWAQYLSDYEDKIVIAPSRWYNGQGDWQYDIYMDDWVIIEV